MQTALLNYAANFTHWKKTAEARPACPRRPSPHPPPRTRIPTNADADGENGGLSATAVVAVRSLIPAAHPRGPRLRSA